ncbi:acyclic terpene utilization AtuA family protein [Haloplanus halophilus]|uniref:acyclic terpene utilization AtuA family protein n=1 Tax=Haloplanus halophilus TaxID=2949993 RepID=UPI00203E7C0E|nr:acyclic terpene utilization AtuA family protein [Haloplanus sp. GDY1]
MTVDIANGAGFWGDYPDATERLLEYGSVDYLTLEYLAEVSIGILARLERSDRPGYVTDFLEFVVDDHIDTIADRDVSVVTNAGGLDPQACARAVTDRAADRGVDVRVAVVTGDDVLGRLPEIKRAGNDLADIDSGEPFDAVESASAAVAYLGAFPIADALDDGADVVVTGRVADPALALGPLIHEFGWTRDDHDLLAAGTVAGHLTECGPQVTGGNYLGGWRDVSFDDVGFPIAEVDRNGRITVTKPPDTGGKVTTGTVAEQLVYEIGDPTAYVTPDVVADFTSPAVTQVGEDRVAIDGATGTEPTDEYKVTIHYPAGFKLAGKLLYSRPDALEKARRAAEILESRIDELGLAIDRTHVDYVGHDAAHGPVAPTRESYNEILLRFAAKSDSRSDLRRLAMEFAPLSLAGPPAVAGLTDQGRPSPRRIVDAWPTLISKRWATPEVTVYD